MESSSRTWSAHNKHWIRSLKLIPKEQSFLFLIWLLKLSCDDFWQNWNVVRFAQNMCQMKGLTPRIVTVKKYIKYVNLVGSYRGNTENGQKWSLTPCFFSIFHFFQIFENWVVYEIFWPHDAGYKKCFVIYIWNI